MSPDPTGAPASPCDCGQPLAEPEARQCPGCAAADQLELERTAEPPALSGRGWALWFPVLGALLSALALAAPVAAIEGGFILSAREYISTDTSALTRAAYTAGVVDGVGLLSIGCGRHTYGEIEALTRAKIFALGMNEDRTKPAAPFIFYVLTELGCRNPESRR